MDIVCHLTKCSEGSMVASVRIAEFISSNLKLPLLHTVDQIDEMIEEAEFEGLNNFILVNSPTGFAEPLMREACAHLHHIAKRSIYVQNDYKMKPPSQCKSYCQKTFGSYKGESGEFYGMDLWSTVPDINPGGNVEYIDWNRLTYIKSLSALTPIAERKRDVLYWGALRKGREGRLMELLNGDFPVTISTAPQSFEKFKKWLPNATYTSQFKNLHKELCNYRATIYTQDEKSDEIYCSLANRFYEALSCGVAIFIDKNAVNTFKQAGLKDFEQFIVEDVHDVEWMNSEAEYVACLQKKLWDREYKMDLIKDLHNLYSKVK